MDKLELVTRNLQEVLRETELAELLKKKSPVVYCGYETSGPVHLGHWSSIRKLMDFQKAGFKVKVLLADYHTYLNLKGDMEWIHQMCEYWKETFKALGLKAEFVLGSSFQQKKEYFSDLLTLSHSLTMKRSLRSMQEIARDIDHARLSQLIYPPMQILDMKYLKVDAALGGLEQRKIHMLARETLLDLGWKKPVCLHNPLLVSLQGPQSKMSSSKPETMIFLHDSEENIRKRIGKAFCPKEREGNPIYQIIKMHVFPGLGKLEIKRDKKYGGNLVFKTFEEFDKEFEKIHPADLKAGVSDAIVKMLAPVRKHFVKNKKILKPLEKLK